MSQKKAIQTIVSAELYDLLFEIAAFDNKSVAQLMRDMIESFEPELRKARDLIRDANALSEEARKLILPELERHANQMQGNVEYGMENIGQTIRKESKAKDATVSDPPQHKLPL